MNDLHANLQGYLDGELPSASVERFHEHLVTCNDCQVEMRDLLFLDLAAARAVDWKAERPVWASLVAALQLALLAVVRRWRMPAAFLGVTAAAATLVLTLQMRELWMVHAPTRCCEDRLSSQPYKHFVAVRGADESLGDPPFLALAWLGWRGQKAMIADAYLLRGQAPAAEHWLKQAGTSADAQATRAALDLRQGRPEDAATHAYEALRIEGAHPAALWNRALALRALQLPLAAANAFDDVAALNEPGWAGEAREAAAKLRDESQRRQKLYRDGEQRCQSAMRGEQPYPLDLLGRSGRLARVCFYDVLRSAGTAEAIASLEATAADLDARMGGGAALAGAVAAAKAGINERRQQLSQAYAQAIQGDPTADRWAELMREAREAGQADIELGAMYFLPAWRLELPRYQELAAATGDPWFATLAQERAADVDRHQGQPMKALERLRPYQERCQSGNRVEDRCLTVQRSIAFSYALLHQTLEAKKVARLALDLARAEGDLTAEFNILEELGQVARVRREVGLAQSYLTEVLARAPGSCAAAEFARSELAIAHQRHLDFKEARRQVDLLRSCDQPPSLKRMFAIADLQRQPDLRGDDDEALLQRGAEAIRANPASNGNLALVTHILGRARLEHDRTEGERLLYQAIAEANQIAGTDSAPDKVQLYSYTSLILDAGRREDYQRALELFAAERRWEEAPKCSLWLTADDERLLVLAVPPDGQVQGRYDGARTQPADAQGQGLVPPELLQAVRSCPAIQVIARPPLEGLSGLLPPELAWSHVLHHGEQPPIGKGPRVVVASPSFPVKLGLPELSAPPRSPGALRLEGPDATPARVLQEARTASLLELHVHGLVDPEVADASFLVLSPEAASGNFALTARDVRKEELAGHPLVLLAACDSGDTVADLKEGYGLAEAFVEAGAHAVLAVNARVTDPESEKFFGPLLATIQSGTSPAIALRAAREKWHREHGSSWADQVVLFE
ncbi:MAG TPA: CHAT domain-containing protein [Myxococcaceae bacterium]|jgi:hypothetical protein